VSEPKEAEQLVNELENRVDRLRALYEQYFLGFEKLEPLVPKKDVERRLETLRRMQLRNTGLRFRFTMVQQRFNTYQSYWVRVCRQIEEGTYKRQVQRAKVRAGAQAESAESVYEVDVDVDLLEDASFSDDDFDSRDTEPPAAPSGTSLPAMNIPQAPAVPSVPGGFTPRTQAPPLIRPRLGSVTDGAPPLIRARDDKTPRDPTKDDAMRPDPRTADPLSAPAMPRITAPTPPMSMAPHGRPRIALSGAPQLGASSAPRGVASAAPQPPTKNAGAPATRPNVAPSSSAVAPPPVRSGAPKAGPPTNLSEERIRELYTNYVKSKRARNESTAQITYETVAKSLRESSKRLKEKHGGRDVDFEVTEKDGKTILKPVVR
jgi:hypothetical protein